jgi:hypothetical protein
MIESEDEGCFADTGHAMQNNKGSGRAERLEICGYVGAERLVTPGQLNGRETGQFKNGCHGPASESATPAIDQYGATIRRSGNFVDHGRKSSSGQLQSSNPGRLGTVLFVESSDLNPLIVAQKWDIQCPGQVVLGKLQRGTGIDHAVAGKQVFVE